MPPSYFPLHWESTGDQWWYASPIDYAAANGLYDVVKELLHLDTNLLIKLTSLRRIRRLEIVWDDEAKFEDVARCRSQVARNLFHECETRRGHKYHNSLIGAGYGGWLLYAAASAGNVDFVMELLGRDRLLAFGEGEYGITDILYAAARGKNYEVFKLLLDSALSGKESCCNGAEFEEQLDDESGRIFKKEMMNRAIHAAARGGNWEMLKQLLGSVSDILSYRDAQGCTVLHSAAGRGQVEVVRNLVESFDIINSTDSQGNTSLHVASYRGHLPVVESLILSSPSLALLTNHHGDTFLHMAVAGFRSPGFHRLDKHTELMKRLVNEKTVNLKDTINVRNNEGRTALHLAVIDNIKLDVAGLLMSVPSIDLNIHDDNGMTPLDLLKRRPQWASSEILIKQLISAGGISSFRDSMARNALLTNVKTHGIGTSPGTSFRIPDAEIFLYTGIESASDANFDQASVESNRFSRELINSELSSVNFAARRLKFLLQWPKRRETKADTSGLEDDGYVDSFSSSRNLEDFPIPLRERYSKPCSLPNNKRTLSIRTYLPTPSPFSKRIFTAGLMQAVIQVKPQVPLPNSSLSLMNKQKHVDIMGPSCSNGSTDDGTVQLNCKQGSFSKKYFSFGAQGMASKDAKSSTGSNKSYKHFNSLVA